MVPATETLARELGWRAYIDRAREPRLFPLPEMDLSSEAAMCQLDELYWDKPVCIISRFEGGSDPVGIWTGIRSGPFSGNCLYVEEFAVRSFNFWGSTTRGHPGNIEDIIELPAFFNDTLDPEEDE